VAHEGAAAPLSREAVVPPVTPATSLSARWSRIVRAFAALRIDRTPLRGVPLRHGEAGAAGPWIGPLQLDGEQHHGLAAGAPDSLDWRVYVIGASRLRSCCAVLDEAAVRGPILFTVEARAANGDSVSHGVSVRRASRWHSVDLDLPAAFAGEITIALRVEAAADARAACVWGDPALERRRPLRQIAATGLAALRLMGLRGSMRRAAAASTRLEDDERYRAWLAQRHRDPAQAAVAAPAGGPLISVLTPVYNTDAVWLRRCVETVRQQAYERWELVLSDDGSTDPRTLEALEAVLSDSRIRVIRSSPNRGIVHASNAALAAATGDFVAFLDHDDELAPDALVRVARRIADEPDLDVIYTDEDKIDPSGVRGQPHFKPDWSPDLLRSCMYMSHLTVMRRGVAVEAGGFRPGYEGSQDYDLMLRVVERTARIAHLPHVLYSWRTTPLSSASSPLAKPWAARAARRALEDALHREGAGGRVTTSEATGHFRVRYPIAGTPRISVLMASSARLSTTGTEATAARARAIRAIVNTTAGRDIEIVVADEGALAGAVVDALRGAAHRIVPCPAGRALPFGACVNALARAATGDHLLLVDDAVEPAAAGWLDAMLEFSQRPAIGAVGAVLVRRDGSIEQAGLVLGAGGLAARALHGEPHWTRGHLSNALDVRNASAVSAACLLTQRDVFELVGGFDDRLDAGPGSIDYGLKVRDAGLRIVLTPHARLWYDGPGVLEAVPAGQAALLRAHWGARLDTDPYYNLNFDRRAASYRLPPAAAVTLT
jgi:O-antigen biosynthesis protein